MTQCGWILKGLFIFGIPMVSLHIDHELVFCLLARWKNCRSICSSSFLVMFILTESSFLGTLDTNFGQLALHCRQVLVSWMTLGYFGDLWGWGNDGTLQDPAGMPARQECLRIVEIRVLRAPARLGFLQQGAKIICHERTSKQSFRKGGSMKVGLAWYMLVMHAHALFL